MKKALIVALLCVNVALLAALIGVNLDAADAQTVRGANDYIMATGKVESTFDAIYVVDMKTRRLAGWRFDRTAKKLARYQTRPLEVDFRKR